MTLTVFIGESRNSQIYTKKTFKSFEAFVDSNLFDSREILTSREQYHKLPKAAQGSIKDGPNILACTLNPNDRGEHKRANANVDKINFIAVDIDEVLEEVDFKPLDDYEYVMYETATSTPEAPRYRLFVNCTGVTPPIYKEALNTIFGKLGLSHLKKNKALAVSQLYYLPSHFIGDPDCEVVYNPGKRPFSGEEIDFTVCAPSTPISERPPVFENPDGPTLAKLLSYISPEYRHNFETGEITDTVIGGAMWQGYLGAIKAEFPEQIEEVLAWARQAPTQYVSDDDVLGDWERARPPASEDDMSILSLVKVASLRGYRVTDVTRFFNQLDTDSQFDIFNRDHALVMLGGKTVVYHGLKTRNDINFASLSEFKNFHKHLIKFIPQEKGPPKVVEFVTYWQRDERAQRYLYGTCLEHDPKKVDPQQLNLWRGMRVKPDPTGSWSMMHDFLHDIMCQGDKEHYEYAMRWLAWTVQNPTDPTGACFVVRGAKGVGKSFFFEHFAQLFHKQMWISIAKAEDVVGKFNGILTNKCFVISEEALFAGNKEHDKVLKAITTQGDRTVEFKGKDSFNTKNTLSLAMVSNEDWVIPATSDERRYFVLDILPTHKNDRDFFAAMEAQLEENDDSGYKAMLYDLLRIDTTGFKFTEPPRTKGLGDQIVASLGYLDQWLLDLAQHFTIKTDMISGDQWYPVVDIHTLYDSFFAWCEKHKLGKYDLLTLHQFARRIKPIIYNRKQRFKIGEKEYNTMGYTLGTPVEFVQQLSTHFGVELEYQVKCAVEFMNPDDEEDELLK